MQRDHYAPYRRNTPMVAIQAGHFGGYKAGDQGTLVFATAYLPGWDAGQYTVKTNGKEFSFWTEEEMLKNWRYA